MKNFNLKGDSKENFKKLETVLNRVFKRLGTKTYGIIPSSILHAFKSDVGDDGLIFRCVLFEGQVKKVSFLIEKIDGKEKPKFTCAIRSGDTTQSVNVETRKLSHTFNIDTAVKDGDYVEVRQVVGETSPTISNIHVSVLMSLTQKDNEVVEQLTDSLLNEDPIDMEG